ncbi:MAG: hypothetical protein ACLFR0_04550 [Alphaproteobacteria bacterium]
MTLKISTPPNNKPHRRTEAGNVFLFILIGIVLFAAISFVMSRGFRSEGTSKISDRQAELAAADILSYIQRVERGISRVRRSNISENDISLEFDGNFVNANCDAPADAAFPDCQVFNARGGRVSVVPPPANANDGTDWHFTGHTCIADIGNGDGTCEGDSISNEELLMVLRNVDQNVCEALNERLGITGIPADTGGGFSATAFTGTFADNTEIILAGGPFRAACYDAGGNTYHFYKVLMER